MTPQDEGLDVANVVRGLDFRRGLGFSNGMAPPLGVCPRKPEPNIIHGLFNMTKATQAKACHRPEPGCASPPAIIYNTLLSTLETGGGLNLVDCTWPAGTHVPSHLHASEDELLIVIAGILEVCLEERTFRCGAGDTNFTPRNTKHEVRALSEARFIAILTRRSLERPQTV